MGHDPHIALLARAIHETKIALAWGKAAVKGTATVRRREPWPDNGPFPGDWAYTEPLAYVDIAFAQARAAAQALEKWRPEKEEKCPPPKST